MAGNFYLKWNDFHANMSSSLQGLRLGNDFFDVTLACDDAEIKAHKVVLASSSEFLKRVLQRSSSPHPWLYFKGIKGSAMNAIVEFLYTGEADVCQEDLDSFMVNAKELEVKGLSINQSQENLLPSSQIKVSKETFEVDKAYSEEATIDHKSTLDHEKLFELSSTTDISDEGPFSDISLEMPNNLDNSQIDSSTLSSTFTNEKVLEENISISDGLLQCNFCGKTDKSKQNLLNHVETHLNNSYICSKCNKFFKTKNSLSVHLSRTHKNKLEIKE